jgi:hypothetical protein
LGINSSSDTQHKRKEAMPRAPQAQLIWSDLYRHYELHAPDQRVQCFQKGDEPGWLNWLEAHASFAFAGQTGRLSLLKETRPRGSGYWYAYQKQGQQARKRYLGRSNQVTFARLEQEAHALTSQPESASSAPRPDTPSSEIKRAYSSQANSLSPVCQPLW